MTIPIQQPQINPQFVQNQQTPGLEVLARALQQRQELEMARQQLRRQQEQFELNKRIGGAQLEGMELENAKKKKELKDAEDDLLARDQALQIFTGNLPRLGDANGVGEVIAGIKDKRIAAHFYNYLQDHMQVVNSMKPSFDIVPSGTGQFTGINRADPSKTVNTGVPVPPDAASRRVPVVTEREKASAAVSTIRANTTINRLETTDPTIGQRVAAKVAIRKSVIGGLMRRLAGTSQEDANLLAEQQIEQSMTPDELEYYVAGKQLLSGILPGLSGKQVTAREYVMHAPAYLSMGSTSPSVIAGRRKARTTRIRGFIAEAGDAMADRMAELSDVDLAEYGLAPVQQTPGTTVQPKPTRKRRPENPY